MGRAYSVMVDARRDDSRAGSQARVGTASWRGTWAEAKSANEMVGTVRWSADGIDSAEVRARYEAPATKSPRETDTIAPRTVRSRRFCAQRQMARPYMLAEQSDRAALPASWSSNPARIHSARTSETRQSARPAAKTMRLAFFSSSRLPSKPSRTRGITMPTLTGSVPAKGPVWNMCALDFATGNRYQEKASPIPMADRNVETMPADRFPSVTGFPSCLRNAGVCARALCAVRTIVSRENIP